MEKKVVIFFVALFIIILVFISPFSKFRELNMKNRALTEKIDYLKKANATLEKEIKKLDGDIKYVEKRAREKIGVVKEGEVVYKVVPDEE
ncbi:MAG: hypothetical protein COS99_01155 [Candidatus Omnitrophica bacterium CG07_land_8_20_14_0_80_42_15]|uniref:Cell division protein FtsB n=1 Tax=Candidatus Aquitaenariimonas noxiae TaxID=1974741 RepID=A0A2J0KUS1_9BACT|nr:MAG: hypothetical protein COS99_01155 [Candidatus Omnitrophica bacterium CG07_land_8_20_14_0_80_42_15]